MPFSQYAYELSVAKEHPGMGESQNTEWYLECAVARLWRARARFDLLLRPSTQIGILLHVEGQVPQVTLHAMSCP